MPTQPKHSAPLQAAAPIPPVPVPAAAPSIPPVPVPAAAPSIPPVPVPAAVPSIPAVPLPIALQPKPPTPRSAVPPPFVAPQNPPITPDGFTVKQKALIGVAAGLTGIALAVFIYNKFWLVAENHERQESLNEGTSSSYANRIKMAFDNDGWWGTNVPALRKVLLEIPHKRLWEKIKTSYRKLAKGKHLLTDMEDELTTTEWLEMQAIFSTLPSGASGESTERQFSAISIAKRLNAAFNNVWFGFLTDVDNDAVNKALEEVPRKREWENVKEAYQGEFAANLDNALDDALWDWYDGDWRLVIAGKPA
jgi:hypothetical protein